MKNSLREQIDEHADLVLQMTQEGASIRAMAEKLHALGVRHPWVGDWGDHVKEIGGTLRAWLNGRMTPVERLQDRIARLETKLAEAEAELDLLLAQPPPPKKIDRLNQWSARNWEIYDRHCSGESFKTLGISYSISRARIQQIVGKYSRKVTRVGISNAINDPEARKRFELGQKQ